MIEVIPQFLDQSGKIDKRKGNFGPSLLVAKKPAVISQSFVFEGDVRQGGNLSIEGHFKGSICCEQLHVALKGVVEAHIECQQLVVKGTLRGSASCHELIVNSTAVVDAHIEYVVMTIGSGAQMGGSLTAKPA